MTAVAYFALLTLLLSTTDLPNTTPLTNTTLLTNTTAPSAQPLRPRLVQSIDDGATEDPPDIHWSAPPSATPAPLADWHVGYRQQMLPVLSAWARMLRRLQGDLPALFDQQCTGLVSSLARLDEATLLPVPDRLIDFYLRKLLLHLQAAGVACTRQQLFNVVYRLEEARSQLGEIRWLLKQQGLGQVQAAHRPE